MTRDAMAEYLERYGWTRAPRKPGERTTWLDPLDGEELGTMEAYEIARERAGRDRT